MKNFANSLFIFEYYYKFNSSTNMKISNHQYNLTAKKYL